MRQSRMEEREIGMKIKFNRLICRTAAIFAAMGIVLSWADTMAAATNDLASALQKGLFEEEANLENK